MIVGSLAVVVILSAAVVVSKVSRNRRLVDPSFPAELTPCLNADGKLVTRGDRDGLGNPYTLPKGFRFSTNTSSSPSPMPIPRDTFWGPYS